MGRKKGNRHTQMIVRVSEEEKNLIKKLAAEEKINVNTYIVEKAMNGNEVEVDHDHSWMEGPTDE